MISINDFLFLPFNKQCDFITVFADYLMNRVELDKKYYLYNMGGFFVEVCYSPSERKINNINAFKNDSYLEPYLNQIEIPVSSV